MPAGCLRPTGDFCILPPAVMPAAASRVSSTPRGDPDRHAWPARIAVSAYGVRVGVRATGAALFERLRERLPPGSETIDVDDVDAGTVDFLYSVSSDPCYVGYAGTAAFVETADEELAIDTFESTVRFDVAVATTDWVFVHAGVVGWHGGAMVIPAPSMHGKSRLVDALVRAGATYYSDEFAVIDRRGLVHPFRIPLSLRNDSGGARRVRPIDSGDVPALPIRLVVSTAYEPGAEWQPRRGTAGEGLIALLSNTVRARIAPREAMQTLARAVEHAAMIASPRGNADEVAASLLEEWQ